MPFGRKKSKQRGENVIADIDPVDREHAASIVIAASSRCERSIEHVCVSLLGAENLMHDLKEPKEYPRSFLKEVGLTKVAVPAVRKIPEYEAAHIPEDKRTWVRQMW